MKNFKVLTILIIVCNVGIAQQKKVLFLGNSYTEYFNLPQLIVNMGQSTNDIIVVDSHTPGGYTLQSHNSNPTSLAKIAQGNWDFVVLQEQSQLPSSPINQVQTQVFPSAESLNTKIIASNPCAETVFYMTWGRQNGDGENCGSNPPVCTYVGMDNLLKERYLTMTNTNNAIVAPVSVVWRYLRDKYQALNLYDPDGSHPSFIGSYVAACAFYTIILRKDPTLIAFNSSLSVADANIIKTVTKNLIFDYLQEWKVGIYDPNSNFSFTNSSTTALNFINKSTNSSQYVWDFGDNTTSTEINPAHVYASAGQYVVKLSATKCGLTSQSQQTINTSILSNNSVQTTINTINIYPNPITDVLFIDSKENINKIEIFDIFGRQIQNYKVVNSSINFNDKNAGLYFLKIYSDSGLIIKKVIKK